MNYLTTSGNSSFRIQGHERNKTSDEDVSNMAAVVHPCHRLKNEVGRLQQIILVIMEESQGMVVFRNMIEDIQFELCNYSVFQNLPIKLPANCWLHGQPQSILFHQVKLEDPRSITSSVKLTNQHILLLELMPLPPVGMQSKTVLIVLSMGTLKASWAHARRVSRFLMRPNTNYGFPPGSLMNLVDLKWNDGANLIRFTVCFLSLSRHSWSESHLSMDIRSLRDWNINICDPTSIRIKNQSDRYYRWFLPWLQTIKQPHNFMLTLKGNSSFIHIGIILRKNSMQKCDHIQ